MGLICQFAQILAKKVFHGDKVFAIDTAEIVNLNDVFMLKMGRKLGLINKGLYQVALIGEVRQYLFYGDQFFKAMSAGDLGTIQFGHTAHSNFLQQLIFTEFFLLEIFHLLVDISAIREGYLRMDFRIMTEIWIIPAIVSPVCPLSRLSLLK